MKEMACSYSLRRGKLLWNRVSMTSRILVGFLVLFCNLCATKSASAQGCTPAFTFYYTEYITEAYDGTNIQQTVQIPGIVYPHAGGSNITAQ
jgi:hypothetical protein